MNKASAKSVNETYERRTETGFKKLLRNIARDRYLYLLLAPFLAYYIIFCILPYSGLRMAFMNYKPLLGYDGSKWVGWQNFEDFFKGPYFWRLMKNTLLLNIYGMFWGFPIPIILAVLFNEIRVKWFRTAAQTISYVPYFISSVVIAGLVISFLSPSTGVVNFILKAFGAEPIYFMIDPKYFRTIFIAQGIWSGAGFGSIIYYSSICSIDSELYEAAAIDGAGKWKQLWKITLPGISSTIAIMLILNMGSLLNTNTDMVLLLQLPATYEASDVLGTYVYRMGLVRSNYSLSTAVSLFNGAVSFLLVFISNRAAKRIGDVSIF
jgi:putative aldouronate transport system permease protein